MGFGFREMARRFIVSLSMELQKERNPQKRIEIIDSIFDKADLGELDQEEIDGAVNEGQRDADRAQNN